MAVVLNAVLRHQVGLSGDEPYYSRIAAHPSGPHNFPYAFRVGLPYLVHILPFAQSFSWEALALLCAGAAGGALFALLREFDVGDQLALGLVVGFTVSPPLLVVFLRNGREVDAAAILVIVLGAYFIVRRRRVALAVTLLVGATIHESCLFLIPLAYAVWAEHPLDRDAARDLALVAAVPIILYAYLRASIVAVGEHYQPGYEGPFVTERVNVLKLALGHGGWHQELRRMALAYGPLWLAAPFSVLGLRFARRGLVLVALCACAMTFALDWGRMIFFAAPVVYVAAAHTLRHRHRRRLAVAAVVALLAMDAGYAIYMQVHGVRSGLDSNGPPARGPVAWLDRSEAI
ncbi:MAG TPA: hypothetical protein VHV28_03800 [Solirubrobacteraceae bacterium]|nr:hypothetical protein [Solirubrobacteraceae bacterium]